MSGVERGVSCHSTAPLVTGASAQTQRGGVAGCCSAGLRYMCIRVSCLLCACSFITTAGAAGVEVSQDCVHRTSPASALLATVPVREAGLVVAVCAFYNHHKLG